RLGRLDVVCNVGGILRFDHSPELALGGWSRGGAVQLAGPLLACRPGPGRQGARANSTSPGSIEPPITKAFHIPDGANPKLVRRIMPLTGFAGPEKVANLVAFVASEEGSHITGEEIRVDGGALS